LWSGDRISSAIANLPVDNEKEKNRELLINGKQKLVLLYQNMGKSEQISVNLCH
jgi:hypothetical protein